MKKTIKTLAFAVVMVLSLSVSATDAFAKDARHGRETAWTDLEPMTPFVEIPTEGVTWEE